MDNTKKNFKGWMYFLIGVFTLIIMIQAIIFISNKIDEDKYVTIITKTEIYNKSEKQIIAEHDTTNMYVYDMKVIEVLSRSEAVADFLMYMTHSFESSTDYSDDMIFIKEYNVPKHYFD